MVSTTGVEMTGNVGVPVGASEHALEEELDEEVDDDEDEELGERAEDGAGAGNHSRAKRAAMNTRIVTCRLSLYNARSLSLESQKELALAYT